MQIFRKIVSNIGNFTRFEEFSKLTKHKIFKLLSRANGSTQLHETQDSERYLSKYFTDPKNWKFHMYIFHKIALNISNFPHFEDFPKLMS